MSALPGQTGRLLSNTKRSQVYLAQEGTDRPCHLHRLPVDLLTPQIYLLHLKAVPSARDLPGSPPSTDTHPLPARLRCHWIFEHQLGIPAELPLDSEYTTKCALSPRFRGVGRTLMERRCVWTLMGAHSELWPPRCFSQHPSLIHRSPGLFPLFQEKLPDLWLQEEPEVLWDPGF